MARFETHIARIPEVLVEGKRLGRNIGHDSRSNLFRFGAGAPTSASHQRMIPVLDQGAVGSCTGDACTGDLGTQPLYAALQANDPTPPTLDQREALRLYSAAEVIDGDGPYPPNDHGSTGLSVAQAAKNAGLCSGYLHALTIDEAYTAIVSGPFMVGSYWYTSFDTPDASGLVVIAPGATVRGVTSTSASATTRHRTSGTA